MGASAFTGDGLELEVEDHGKGLERRRPLRGLGIVAMRERAELVGGTIEFLRPREGGTLVRLRVPVQAGGDEVAEGRHMTDKITVLLADDHSLVRRGFRRLLEDDPDIVVVGEASDGDEAIRLAASAQAARRRDGLRHAWHERADGDAAILAAVAGDRDPDAQHAREETLVRQALEAGARGYVLKNALDLDLAAAVKRVAAGETVLDPKVSRPGDARRASAATA